MGRFTGKKKFVNIEDPSTKEKTKLVTEDCGFCIFDKDNYQLLIEGCACRYVIHAKDDISMNKFSAYSLAGVTIRYRIGTVELGISICPSGNVAIASIILALFPWLRSTSMLKDIEKTLGL